MKPESNNPPAHVPTVDYNREHPLLANPGETQLMQHLPQLDGVRAIAVLLVIWHHFIPAALASGKPVAPWGAIGVGLFFVLSGFLITRILLNCRLKIDDGKSSIGQMLKQFYMRRFLRIFPLYYGVLLVLTIVNPINLDTDLSPRRGDRVMVLVDKNPVDATVSQVKSRVATLQFDDGSATTKPTREVDGVYQSFRDRVWWHVAYLSNVRFSYWQDRGAVERHLWSLSVEEQFYIFWPLIIFLVPRRLLLPLMALAVIGAPVYRVMSYQRDMMIHEWMMPGCLDLLGGGALLALLSIPQFGFSRAWNWLVEFCGVVGVPAFLLYVVTMSVGVKGATGAFEQMSLFGVQLSTPVGGKGWASVGRGAWSGHVVYTLTAVASIWLIASAARGFKGPLGWVLQSAPLVYVGRISYGLYVIHMFVPHLLAWAFPSYGFDKIRTWQTLLIFTGTSVALATLSWYAYEAPLNKLKRFFEYDKGRVKAEG